MGILRGRLRLLCKMVMLGVWESLVGRMCRTGLVSQDFLKGSLAAHGGVLVRGYMRPVVALYGRCRLSPL